MKESGQKRSGGQFQYHNQTLIHIDTVIRGWKVSKSFTATTLTALSIPRQHRAKAYKEHVSAVVHKVLFNQVYLLWHETTVLSSVFTGRGFLSAYLYSQVKSHTCEVLRLFTCVLLRLIKIPCWCVHVHIHTLSYIQIYHCTQPLGKP